MSGEINVTNPDKPKVLIVIANPATSTTLGIPYSGAEVARLVVEALGT